MRDYLFRNIIHNQFLVAIIVVAFAFLLLALKSVLVTIFVAYILMSAIAPFVSRLEKIGLKRFQATAIIYVLILLVVFLLVLSPIPFFVRQLQSLFENFPSYIERVSSFFGVAPEGVNVANLLKSEGSVIGRSAVTLTNTLFGGVFGLLAVTVISFYLTLDHPRIQKNLPEIASLLSAIERKLGAWLLGQLFLGLAVGITVWVGLTLLGIPYAAPIALIAGILEIVPTIGPVIAAIPAIIVALTISPITALVVVGFYILIQVLENYIFVPKIMQRAVGFSPLFILVALIVGGKLAGIAGVLLTIPVALVLSEIVHYFRNDKS